MPEEKKGNLLEKFVPVLMLLTVGLAFAVGVLWQRVKTLEGGGTKVAGTTATNNPAAPDVNGKLSSDQAKKIPQITDKDHVRGPRDAKVFLVEYSDLQCPYCQAFHPTAKQALDTYKGQLAWVYRHFPLYTIHPKAEPAAEAAECVAAEGGEDAFWNFVDKVFAGQPDSLDKLSSIASGVGVATSDFNSCTQAKKYKSIIDNDYSGGTDAGVNGTPGNFVVNKKGEVWVVPGAVPFDTLKATIDAALKG